MTVIVGFSWLSEMVMIADTRVSWPNSTRPPHDILRKLYKIGDTRKSVVLGFSGDLSAAKTIITYLKDRKFKHLRRRFVIARFKDDLRTWIEQAATHNLSPELRDKVRFMLCGVEPSRHPPIHRDGRVVGVLNVPECHLYVYTIGKNSGHVMVSERRNFAVIGSGQDLENEIREKMKELIHFGFDQPNLHWARVFILSDIVASLFKERQSDTVGGPFQTIRLTKDGLQEFYLWPPGVEDKNVEVQQDKRQTTIFNSALNEQYSLYPIWEL